LSTQFFYHQDCLDHYPGLSHPESPKRLISIRKTLSHTDFDMLSRVQSPKAEFDTITLMHDPYYVETIFNSLPISDFKQLDPDTILSPGSGDALLRGVGGICSAVDNVLSGVSNNAFCCMRPPGHHAEYGEAMGFCIFNNIAVAAKYAQKKYGIDKVAVVDFDVHHGNGTQHLFENDPNLFYASTHQYPAYPGTGAISEVGLGNIVNVPLKPGTGSEAFRAAYTKTILPKLNTFEPQLLLVSAGFDAHRKDPLCQLNLNSDDFSWVTKHLIEVADNHCHGMLISTLEGGYDLDALASSVAKHVEELLMYG
jgi:acetoin utilization deacetylase AcuC-like enzyme